MMGLVIVLHVLVCVGLIGIVLIQRGRGGGFVEGFSGLESVFGTKTSSFLTKMTTFFAVTFFLTCLVLAFLSLKQSRSLMGDVRIKEPAAVANATVAAPPEAVEQPIENATSAEAAVEAVGNNTTQESPAVDTKTFPQPRTGTLK